MLEKRYLGDAVYIEIYNGNILLTCAAPSYPNGIFLDPYICDAIKAYKDEAYRRVAQIAAEGGAVAPNVDEPDPDENETGE